MEKINNKKSITSIPKQLVSKKLLATLLDEFAFFGGIPFYVLVTLFAYFIGQKELYLALIYCFLLSFIIKLIITSLHYKERPRKQEFTIFMEKILASSFPSTHSINSTILAALLIITFQLRWIVITTLTFAILVFIQRYVSKKHYFIDILGGILIAIAEIIFVLRIV